MLSINELVWEAMLLVLCELTAAMFGCACACAQGFLQQNLFPGFSRSAGTTRREPWELTSDELNFICKQILRKRNLLY